jgi:uroporphyrin-III C-methyltransferase
LMAAGLSGRTPALMAEAVSQSGQRLTRSTVAALARAISGETASAPALILYGALAGDEGQSESSSGER